MSQIMRIAGEERAKIETMIVMVIVVVTIPKYSQERTLGQMKLIEIIDVFQRDTTKVDFLQIGGYDYFQIVSIINEMRIVSM